jgi:hypothetical protein
MPRGFVTFAHRNSRRHAWFFRNAAGEEFSRERPNRRADHGQYFDFDQQRVFIRDRGLHRDGGINPAYDAATRTQVIGQMWRGLVRTATGEISLKNDASGMFNLIPVHLSNFLGVDNVIARPFENVHDDLDDGGTRAETAANFYEQVQQMPPQLDFFAYCGHGSPSGLESACATGETHVTRLAGYLRQLRSGGTVVLYACSTGVPGGFAQQLSQALAGQNISVWGHTQSGSASTNISKVRYLRGEVRSVQSTLSETARRHWNSRRLPHRIYLLAPFWTPEELEGQIARVVH